MRVVFFFSSRRRHTRYWRDWSSDVCSSDLAVITFFGFLWYGLVEVEKNKELWGRLANEPERAYRAFECFLTDRKSVVEGKSVDLGGRRILKKKNALI